MDMTNFLLVLKICKIRYGMLLQTNDSGVIGFRGNLST